MLLRCSLLKRASAYSVIPLLLIFDSSSFAAKEKEATSLAQYLVRRTNNPGLTDWGPTGKRVSSPDELSNPLFPMRDHYHTFHGSVRSSDEVNIVFSPVVEALWTAESEAFLTETPVFGKDGSSYIMPTQETDNGQNMLIKVSPDGQRVFKITRNQLGDVTYPGTNITEPATKGGGGSPVVLNNPDVPGKETVFVSTYTRAYAVDEDGTLLWNTAVMPPAVKDALERGDRAAGRAEVDKPHRIFGLTYHPAVDAYIAADFSGDIMAFDRKTGLQLGGITMPGSPSTGGDNDIQDAIEGDMIVKLIEILLTTGNKLFLDDGIELELEATDAKGFLAVLGTGAVIANQISVDLNSNSLWVASTALDEADGTIDGRSEIGALYRIDLERTGDSLDFNLVCHSMFEGGTTSTPAVSGDGERVYTTDNFGKAIAVDRDCVRVWEVDVGEAAVASLAVSSEVGAEIYYPTLTSVYKIQENSERNDAELLWAADLDSSFNNKNDKTYGEYVKAADTILEAVKVQLENRLGSKFPEKSISIGASNLCLASVGQNGIIVHSGYGLKIKMGSFSNILPLALNNALYDRATGEWISGNLVISENIGAMYASPDGTIIMGGPGPRSAIMRGLVKAADLYVPEFPGLLENIQDGWTDFVVAPLIGGVTKYGVAERFDLLARDAVCQAEKRIRNTQRYSVPGSVGYMTDVSDTRRMIQQATDAIVDAKAKLDAKNVPELDDAAASLVQSHLDLALAELNETGNHSSAADNLGTACSLLTQ